MGYSRRAVIADFQNRAANCQAAANSALTLEERYRWQTLADNARMRAELNQLRETRRLDLKARAKAAKESERNEASEPFSPTT